MLLNELINDFDVNPDHVGLMTMDEYITKMNPDQKRHDSDSYNSSLKSQNTLVIDTQRVSTVNGHGSMDKHRGGEIYKYQPKNSKEYYTAVGLGDTLYYQNGFNLDLVKHDFFDNAPKYNNFKKSRMIEDQKEELLIKSSKVISDNPHVWQNLKIKDENFQIRSSVERGAYPKNKGVTIIITNSDNLLVGSAQNEWGATLIMVVDEYRGYGLGKILKKQWAELNPEFKSGGFTKAGEQNAKSFWADSVRELLKRGVYSNMIANGEMTKERYKAIITDLPEKKIVDTPVTKKGEVLLLPLDNNGFALYNSNYLDDQDDKWILAYGYIEKAPVGYYVYDIGYEKQYKELAHSILYSVAKKITDRLVLSSPPSEFTHFDEYKEYEIEDEVLILDKPAKDFSNLITLEKKMRKAVDIYDEIYVSIIEDATSKWR